MFQSFFENFGFSKFSKHFLKILDFKIFQKYFENIGFLNFPKLSQERTLTARIFFVLFVFCFGFGVDFSLGMFLIRKVRLCNRILGGGILFSVFVLVLLVVCFSFLCFLFFGFVFVFVLVFCFGFAVDLSWYYLWYIKYYFLTSF